MSNAKVGYTGGQTLHVELHSGTRLVSVSALLIRSAEVAIALRRKGGFGIVYTRDLAARKRGHYWYCFETCLQLGAAVDTMYQGMMLVLERRECSDGFVGNFTLTSVR